MNAVYTVLVSNLLRPGSVLFLPAQVHKRLRIMLLRQEKLHARMADAYDNNVSPPLSGSSTPSLVGMVLTSTDTEATPGDGASTPVMELQL